MLKLNILENRLKDFLNKNSFLIIVCLVILLIAFIYLLSFFLYRLSEGHINYKKLLDQYHEQTVELQKERNSVKMLSKIFEKNIAIQEAHDINFVSEILPKSNTNSITAALLFTFTMGSFVVATPYAFAINSCIIFIQGIYDGYADQANFKRLRCLEIAKYHKYMQDPSKIRKKLQPTNDAELQETIDIMDFLDKIASSVDK